jgi:hypothetical protein
MNTRLQQKPKIQLLDTLWQKKRSQALALQNLGYKIVMWDILSADFDTETTKEKCLKMLLQT